MKQPDIEIYLKDAELSTIAEWLQNALGQCSEWQKKGHSYHCHTLAKKISINFYPNAVGKWHCLYFASSETPWLNDRACAEAASDYLAIEIRCAPTGWTEEVTETEEQIDRWLKINQQQITEFIWKTH